MTSFFFHFVPLVTKTKQSSKMLPKFGTGICPFNKRKLYFIRRLICDSNLFMSSLSNVIYSQRFMQFNLTECLLSILYAEDAIANTLGKKNEEDILFILKGHMTSLNNFHITESKE